MRSRVADDGDQERGDGDLRVDVRVVLADAAGITDKAMFGDLAFRLDGNMSVESRAMRLMVSVGPEASDETLSQPRRVCAGA